jgi:hypothetical protein
MEGSDNEISIIAGSVLSQIIKLGSSNRADAVCLCLSCMEVQGLRKKPRLQAVIEDASKYHSEEAVRVRALNLDPVQIDFTEFMKSVEKKGGVSITDYETTWSAVTTVLQNFTTLLSDYNQTINEAFNDTIERQREESGILWWLFSENTLDGKTPFSKLAVPQACFRGAKDLSDLTVSIPGPFAAHAFLTRMLYCVKKKLPDSVKLIDVIGQSDIDWLKSLAESIRLDSIIDICPFHFAAIKAVEVGGTTAWSSAFEHATGLDANCELPPLEMALQIYNESLLIRVMKD